jgi:hypothetical protein
MQRDIVERECLSGEREREKERCWKPKKDASRKRKKGEK